MSTENELYPIWNDVPVMYQDCATLEQKIKHRLRRAAEKADDYQLGKYEQAELSWKKLQVIEEIFGGEDKYVAWALGSSGKVDFKSDQNHCASCVDEKERGYGDGVDGCCCTHVAELHAKESNEHR